MSKSPESFVQLGVRSVIPNRVAQIRKTIRGYKTQEHEKAPLTRLPSSAPWLLAIHFTALLAALVLVALNVGALWVGGELRGSIGQDERKLLALQLTAKLHELLMLASLKDVLLSSVLKELTLKGGMPLGVLAAGMQFTDISYLWSKEFIATCITAFSGKRLILPLIATCTILGVLIGPSSATAMIPTITEWPHANLQFTMNVTSQDLWPSSLSTGLKEHTVCSRSTGFCGHSSTVTILAESFFRYWGQKLNGEVYAMPEKVDIPGRASVRSLNARFRGVSTIYQPDFTAVTVQPAAMADALNELRLMYHQASLPTLATMHFGDLKWSLKTRQPNVYVACHENQRAAKLLFPTLTLQPREPKLAEHVVDISNSGVESTFSPRWLNLENNPQLTGVSIGVLVTQGAIDQSENVLACSVDAQWADVIIETSFAGLPYAVMGIPTSFFAPQAPGNTYHGQHVKLTPDWATVANPFLRHDDENITAFDRLFNAGLAATSPAETAAKVEAILAVLLAESMAQVHAEATIRNSSTANAQETLQSIKSATLHTSNPSIFDVDITKIGYSYGLRTTKSFSFPTLTSVIILLLYCSISLFHLASLFFISDGYVNSWRGPTDLLVLALHSASSAAASLSSMMQNTSAGVETLRTMQVPVAILAEGKHAEIVLLGEVDGDNGHEGHEEGEQEGKPHWRRRRIRKDVLYA